MKTESRPRRQAAVGVLLAIVAVVAFLAGRVALSILVGLLCVVAYGELRRMLSPAGNAVTMVAGGAAVVAYLWLGFGGRLSLLPWVTAALVLLLLTIWVVLHEATGRANGATDDVAATVAASAVVGILGAHVLLIRAVPRFGSGGVLVFGLMVLLNDAAAFVGGRALGQRPLARRISPSKTLEGAFAGLVASVMVGAVAGFVWDPPFDPATGTAFGLAVGLLAPIGDVAFSAVKRGAARNESGRAFGPLGGALDVVDALLFCAPAFYWAFRTVAL